VRRIRRCVRAGPGTERADRMSVEERRGLRGAEAAQVQAHVVADRGASRKVHGRERTELIRKADLPGVRNILHADRLGERCRR
jgi:hypothetical protein